MTTMLVMYTLNQSVSRKLPPTSYIKLIDVWLLFGLILPFFITILLIIIEHLPKSNKNIVRVGTPNSTQESLKIHRNFVERFARIYLPILEILLVVLYATVVIVLWQ